MRLLVHGPAGYTKGGIETFLFEMSRHMSDQTVFDYVIEKDKTSMLEKLPGKGETFFIAPKRHMLSNLISWNRLLNDRKGKDSAVYFNWYSMAWLVPAILARLKGYPVIIHACNNKLHNCGRMQRTMHNICRELQKCMKIKRLTNSDLSARFFFDNKPAVLIHNAIDLEKFRFRSESREQVRSELGITDRHIYGFSGRIAYQKNPLYLMRIFKEIRKLDSKAAFLVCGDGDMMEETRKRAEAYKLNVLFVGSVQDMPRYYAAMDVFILPSRFEGLGNVLIEAQCAGLPCMASADVIPALVRQTDLLSFINLHDGPAAWAKHAAAAIDDTRDRAHYYHVMSGTDFDIRCEAPRLERVLNSCK